MSTQNYEQLLQFLYRVPVGLMEVDSRGAIRLMNAYATSLLMPIADLARNQNFFDIVAPYAPELPERFAECRAEHGTVTAGERISLPSPSGQPQAQKWYSFTIERLGGDSYMVAFSDVTEEVEREERLKEVSEEEAEQRGRMEIAGSVLHDIGNAVSGLSTQISRLLGEPSWRETTELKRLAELLEAEAESLGAALGEERQKALSAFVGELIASLESREGELRQSASEMAQTLDHVSETLSLQRQYAREWVAHAAEPVNLIRLIEDAVAMQLGGFEKRGVKLRREYPSESVLVHGDRTKLVRVLVNLFKNALESFDDPGCCSEIEPQISISVAVEGTEDGRYAVVTASDNGAGFTQPPQSLTSDRKSTDKPGGTGMGLYAARRIVEAHGGALSLSSEGTGMGVAARMSLPVVQEISG